MLKELPNAKLIVVGPDGGYKSKCVALTKRLNCENNVIFTGPLNEKELACAFEVADVVIFPSAWEAYGRVVLEAWAHKKPIVVTKSVGLAELVSKERGILINYGDRVALTNSVIKLLTDAKLASSLGLNGYNLVKAEFEWGRVVEKIIDTYMYASGRVRRVALE